MTEAARQRRSSSGVVSSLSAHCGRCPWPVAVAYYPLPAAADGLKLCCSFPLHHYSPSRFAVSQPSGSLLIDLVHLLHCCNCTGLIQTYSAVGSLNSTDFPFRYAYASSLTTQFPVYVFPIEYSFQSVVPVCMMLCRGRQV